MDRWYHFFAWMGLPWAVWCLCASIVRGQDGEQYRPAEDPWRSSQPAPLIEQWPTDDGNQPDVDEESLLFAPQREQEVISPSKSSLGSLPGDDRSPLRVSALWIPAQEVRGQGTELTVTGLQASLAFPIRISPDGRNLWLLMTGFEHLELAGGAILPDSLVPLPDELWKVNIGTMHIREFDSGWRGGAMLTVGAASDKPFAGIRDMTATALGFLTVPSGERDAWSFSLFYSPTSQLPFPIPGVAYVWQPNDQLTANIGVPFSVRYQPTETFTLAASYRPLTNVSVRASQAWGPYWTSYASYQVVNETYWLSDRTVTNERLYLFDQRASLGIERTLMRGFSLDLSAAYVFDRRIFQAESFSDDRRDVLSIDPGPALTLLLKWSR